jgi:hypothetical protein
VAYLVVLSRCAEQALAADRNQRVSHRQLVASAVVARPLKRNVGLLAFEEGSSEMVCRC